MNGKNVIALFTISAGIYALWQMTRKKLTLEQKMSRRLAACRIEGCAMLNGSDYSIIKTPSLPDNFYSATDKETIRRKIDDIKAEYGTIVQNVSKLTNVPEMLLYAFIFIESSGNQYAISGKAIGLMQLSPAGASDMLFLENKRGRLLPGEKIILRKYLGTRFDSITRMKYMGDGIHVLPDDLSKPEFNILTGAIYLGILLDEHTEGDYVRMDKVVTRYNRGYFTKNLSGDYNSFYLTQNTTTRAYILKLVGTHGIIDILTT